MASDALTTFLNATAKPAPPLTLDFAMLIAVTLIGTILIFILGYIYVRNDPRG